jgi:class 3 adenylate cyclase
VAAAGLACASCGIELRGNARFCDECGAPVTPVNKPAEYKQVTVLFADVVHSMEIAAAVGAERLREIMTELVSRSAAVVQRYGGTVDKFTGDGIMAVFGAPTALEDHAFRACLAAFEIQDETKRLAAEFEGRDGIALQLRIGLNSGEVIAGEIGTGAFGYTAVGEQVGLAQRMESAALPGGVMLSESTAKLVEHAAELGGPEMVRIKGAGDPVPARRLLGVEQRHGVAGRVESTLVGRQWEMSAVEGVLGRAINGRGGVVGVVGPAGIGKSRMVREVAALAAARGVDVFYTFCESHTRDISFHVVARLLRAGTGVADLDGLTARAQVRAQVPDADPQDLLLLDDLLGIADPDAQLPKIDPDARRRRLTALINAASLARTTSAVFVIEDAHWIDEVSESMLADFLAVIPQTPSMVVITYRPDYHGALARVSSAQTIALAPLSDSETSALVVELLGSDPSLGALARTIAERACGNPFFAEEMVRELVQRGVLDGDRGAYMCRAQVADVTVPATLQATIAARIDRLEHAAKGTLSAGAVIGSRFGPELLTAVGVDPVVDELIAAELIDQVRFTPCAEYAFHHPLIRTVAYESQLKSDRARLHQRLAAVIEEREPASVDENAGLIAQHLEAAGELRGAYDWHMRAGTWLTNRDIAAARLSWQRARDIVDRLPTGDRDRTSMQIAPRTLLCLSAWRAGGSVADTGFDELRELCNRAGDQRSLAIGMAGLVMALTLHGHYRDSSRLASEYTTLLESIGDDTLTVGLSFPAILAKYEAGEMAAALRLAQRVIDLADGDPAKGNLIMGSPLAVATAMGGLVKCCLGLPGWRGDADRAVTMGRGFDPTTHVFAIMYRYVPILLGAVLPHATALRETADALAIAERSGDDWTLAAARFTRGFTLVYCDGPEREAGLELLAMTREAAVRERLSVTVLPFIDTQIAKERARSGDVDRAIELARAVIDDLFETGEMFTRGLATTVLVEALLERCTDTDLQEAQAKIERLAVVPTDPGFVLHELPLLRLRALLARARGDEVTYRDFADRYRRMATDLGFEGHIVLAKAMT